MSKISFRNPKESMLYNKMGELQHELKGVFKKSENYFSEMDFLGKKLEILGNEVRILLNDIIQEEQAKLNELKLS